MSPVLPAFPSANWAWPRGAHHQLLLAVLHADQCAALEAARAWLDSNDIDAAGFREQRLLATMAQVFDRQLVGHPAFPRLVGLSRYLWARAQLARRATMPAVALLATAMPVMLLKGIGRVALDPKANKGRISHDIDVLVPRGRLGEAMDLLLGAGWAPDQRQSAQRLKAQTGWLRAVNLYHGNLGNIDLHQRAYHDLHQDAGDDLALWKRACPVRFEGLGLLVPSAADRAAIAIAHGMPEGHAHSDWLVDAAVALADPGLDVEAFDRILALRQLDVLAEPCLAYLAKAAALPLLPSLVARVSRRARRRPLTRLVAFALARPVQQQGTTARLLKIALRPLRKRLTRDAPPPAGAQGLEHVHGRRLRARAAGPQQGCLRVEVAPQPEGVLRIVLRIPFAGVRRRAELELNTPGQHVTRLSYRNRRESPHPAEVLFEIALGPQCAHQPLELTARPLGILRRARDEATRARLAPLPFAVVSVGNKSAATSAISPP